MDNDIGTSLVPPLAFSGGTSCSNGNNICTCDHFGSRRISQQKFTDGAGQTLRRATAEPLRCAEACRVDAACTHAFFRVSSGDCFLLNACSSKVSTWVGNWGGVTFEKYFPPPPPAPPALPPSLPPHALRVDPGEGVWPTDWFGTMHTPEDGWGTVVAPTWVGSAGVSPGYDFTLPPGAGPSLRSSLTLSRMSGTMRPLAPRVATTLPAIHFPANKVLCIWAQWWNFEPSEGVYDFSLLHENINAAVAAGWSIAIRFLTARTIWAPRYMADHNVTIMDEDTMVSSAPVGYPLLTLNPLTPSRPPCPHPYSAY